MQHITGFIRTDTRKTDFGFSEKKEERLEWIKWIIHLLWDHIWKWMLKLNRFQCMYSVSFGLSVSSGIYRMILWLHFNSILLRSKESLYFVFFRFGPVEEIQSVWNPWKVLNSSYVPQSIMLYYSKILGPKNQTYFWSNEY